MNKELEAAGVMRTNSKFNFSFKKVALPFESYEGAHVSVK
jgi:hypothetical protein